MKKIILFCLILLSSASYAQVDSTLPPFKRFPNLPPIQLLLADSTTKYTKKDIPKNKPVLLMLFSPDCSHCQHTAEEMVQRKDELKNITIIMATLHSIKEMNAFVDKYGLNQIPNVTIGKDLYYIMPSFYAVKNFPYLAFYNKKGQLIMGYEGSMPLSKIINTFK
ncbi:thioredoxin family protein [Chitinophagaceae bacterium LB-8]|uniref:Thioredoxin family protein n=1 Tax=Paraflavisolibacter caeni TaxID=2982496 RepID=A0A9X2XTT9_9BACT|nr:thioredoxin domain-containing protein [Paraflavisolibacter caeni]MCU7548237.1 thioredoxin family protein [Paraflavisolibacter caeni]